MRAQATMPLERATYHGILSMGQLPPVLVCELAPVEDGDAVVELVARVADFESSESSDEDEVDDEAVVLDFVLLAATDCVVVALCPSRQASTPPSESMVATLIAVATLRAPAALGLRRRLVRGAVGSSMTVNVRTGGERRARGD